MLSLAASLRSLHDVLRGRDMSRPYGFPRWWPLSKGLNTSDWAGPMGSDTEKLGLWLPG